MVISPILMPVSMKVFSAIALAERAKFVGASLTLVTLTVKALL